MSRLCPPVILLHIQVQEPLCRVPVQQKSPGTLNVKSPPEWATGVYECGESFCRDSSRGSGGPGLPPGWLALKELWLSTAGGPDRVGGLETPHPEAAGTKLLSHFTEGTINNLAKVTQVGEIAFMNGVQVISTFGFLPLSPGNLE